ncbi:rhomboid family intramembrane serine protease [Halococcus agarilyticus]|uniref:rhomboid family intramembrane serine protease n=1 Tax=Halococcus agarilyticus TaxID=1232219 RepID=UPI000AA78D02|nr:rhomboid family intramembrane serine protease [Halococcus agarilyticus]
MAPWQTLARIAVPLAAAISLVAIYRLDGGEWGERLRARFLAGIPWGTLLTAGGLLGVYLFVQNGLGSWYWPVVLPFRAWSYLYPLGMGVASFAHVGPGHLIGNLVGVCTFGVVAEYAWGHYPAERGASTFSSLRTNPFARVLAVPAAAVAVGLVVAVFSIGPVIGFSGVVFAFAGVALVRYPVTTVLALSAGGVVRLVYRALRNPVVEASAEPSFGTPWWAGIAIQAHAIGLLIGILIGVALCRRRSVRPPPGRLWLGTLLFAVGQSLWAVYWFRGNGEYVLFRAVGAVLVFGLALVVAASVAAPDRLTLPRPDVPRLGRIERLGELGRGGTIRRRAASAGVIALALAVLAAPAVPVNLTTVDAPTEEVFASGAGTGPQPGIDADVAVRDYTVTYTENITNRKVSVFDVSAFGETTQVRASGVIVESDERHVWTTAIQASELAFDGWSVVKLGGLGWSETVAAKRNGWQVVGGGNAYKVYLNGPGEGRQLAYRSAPATAGPVIAGKNVSLAPRQKGFDLVVSRNNETLGSVALPDRGNSTRAANLTFDGRKRLFVGSGGRASGSRATRTTNSSSGVRLTPLGHRGERFCATPRRQNS